MGDDATSADERRKDGRHPIELKVEYQRLNSFFSDYTRNISKGGTFIKTAKPLDVGTDFVFKLFVPTLEGPIRIRGQVQWVVSEAEAEAGDPRSEEAGMGIRFEFRDDAELEVVKSTVERLMVDSLGQRLYTRLMEHSREHAPDAAIVASIASADRANDMANDESNPETEAGPKTEA